MHRKVIAFVVAALGMAGCSRMPPASGGAPVGGAAWAGDSVAMLMHSQEAGMPALHRNPENDRYRLSLLLISADGKQRRQVPLATGLRGSEFLHGARIFGDDGKLLWFHGHQPAAYDYRANRLIQPRDLPKSGAPRRNPPFGVVPHDRFLSPAEQFADRYPKAAIVLDPGASGPLRLANPDGMLVLYKSKQALYGRGMLSRIDEAGHAIWTTNTNLQDMEQILPGTHATAFIGKLAPQHKDEVRGPTLVIVNHATGEMSTHSLWGRP
jgi:hypothetical protein